MSETLHYDAVVIGAGQGGGPLASALARAGRKTALIEREHVGGTCINEGCTPTKTMVASARAAYLARRGADYGVHTGEISVDMERVRQRKRAIVESFRGGSERRIKDTEGLDLLMGEARFTGPHALAVRLLEQKDDPSSMIFGVLESGRESAITAETIVINTGARPSRPPLEGLDSVPALDSTTIMELDTVPEHLIVLGGGYVGLEFGQMFRRFGSAVSIVQRGPNLLGREDPDIASAVEAILREDGIEVLLETEALSVARGADGAIRLTVRSTQGERELHGSHLLLAAGRTPNTEALHLAAAGIATDRRGNIVVNEKLETNVPGIYALGDVNGGPAFTHISYDDYRILRSNLIPEDNSYLNPVLRAPGGGSAVTTGRMVPYTVFIDPQLGRVGLTETEARAQGRPIRVATMPMSDVARALEVDESRGLMKVIVDAESGQILGCAILGLEGGEIMAMLQIAMMGTLRYTVLRDAIFAHPTLAESLNNLFSTLDG